MDLSDSSLMDEESQREVEALQDINFSDEFIVTSGNESATQTPLPNPPKQPTNLPLKQEEKEEKTTTDEKTTKEEKDTKGEKPKMSYFSNKLAAIILELNNWEKGIGNPVNSSTQSAPPQPLSVEEFLKKMNASIEIAASTPKRPKVTIDPAIQQLGNLDVLDQTSVPQSSNSTDITNNLKRASSAVSDESPAAKRITYDRHRCELCHTNPNCPLPCNCLCKRCILLHSDRVPVGCQCRKF